MQHPEISIIIPAYQEERRIGNTIESLSVYLEKQYPASEIIVVCDGCTDKTAEITRQAFAANKCTLKIIELPKNTGKGAAVKAGIKQSQGNYIIFTDADLSFHPDTIEKFLPILISGADVVIAQRNKSTVYPGFGRRVLATLSRFVVGNFLLRGIRDSQAGYKAFSRHAAQDLFASMRTKRFLFDLEILLIARQKKYKIEKVYVDWKDKPGSTVRLFIDSLICCRDLFVIYFCYFLGKYD